MYTVTWLKITDKGPAPKSMTTPDRAAAMTVHDALRLAGVHVRLFCKGALVQPTQFSDTEPIK